MKIKGKTLLLTAKLVLILVLCASIQVLAAVHDLSPNPSLWDKELQDYGSILPGEACTFEISNDELHIGPWLAGEYAARYAYKQDFNIVQGTVQGYYKTQGTEDGQAQVAIYFKDSNGSIKYKYKFQLPNATQWTAFSFPIRRGAPDSVKIAAAFGNSIKNNGKVYFKNLQVTDTPWSIQFPANPPALTREAPPTNFVGTGKWRLEQRMGTWWFVKPNGDAFYSLGLEAPYVDDPTTREVFDMIEGLSFNTLGGWTDIYKVGPVNDQRSEPFPALVPLESGTLPGTFDRLVSAKGEAPNIHTMPDPFDPRWKQALKNRISTIKSRTDGKDWFIGYFADNEVSHYDLHRCVYSNYCSQAFKSWLITRYNNSIASLNDAWGKSYASFNALMTAKPDPIKRSGTMYEDFMAFKRVIVQKYVDESKSAFMEVYNNNPPLIFSNRFIIDMSDVYDVMDIYGAAYDGIAVNCYPGGTQVGLPQWMKGTIEKAYSIAQKPIVIGEWSVPALDSGLYNDWSKLDFSFTECVDTQTERARQAAYLTAEFYNEPFIVGTHWYKWHDLNDSSRKANRGIYKADGRTPWPELQAALKSIHEQINEHTSSSNPPVDPPADPIEVLAVADSYVRGGSSYRDKNYGTESILNIKDSSSETYDRMAYLKFELGNNSPNGCSNAVLKLYCRNLPNGKPVTAKAFGVANDSWSETGINWVNKPALGSQLSSVSITATGTVYSFDVTSFVSSQLAGDGVVSICIMDDVQCNKEIHFDSREGSIKPVLEITY